jgi:hypothetical protein
MKKRLLLAFGFVALLVGCKPGTPSQYIQPDDMEDILVDYHLAKAMADNYDGPYEERAYQQALYIEAVMRKHGVTKAEFDSSLVYYYRRADRFDEMYKEVADRLEELALTHGATEGEIGKYSSLSSTGDTANIWSERSRLALVPTPPYNRWPFEIAVDSAFYKGDSFLMQFMSDYMFQDGSRSTTLYMAVTYDNDTTISKHIVFTSAGLTQLRIPAFEDRAVKRMRGYFYLGGGSERTTTTRVLFLDNIQLIRFHSERHEETQKDSIESDSIGRQLNIDSVGGGNIQRGSDEMVSADSGIAKHRMVRRPDLIKER